MEQDKNKQTLDTDPDMPLGSGREEEAPDIEAHMPLGSGRGDEAPDPDEGETVPDEAPGV